jgi:hypothetical protein
MAAICCRHRNGLTLRACAPAQQEERQQHTSHHDER